jgi:hypothetical protein
VAVGELRARVPAALREARPSSAFELVGALARALPTEARALLVARPEAPLDVVAGLEASALAAAVPAGEDPAQLVLLALASPAEVWGEVPARVHAELDTFRDALAPPARQEVARLRAQLVALGEAG